MFGARRCAGAEGNRREREDERAVEHSMDHPTAIHHLVIILISLSRKFSCIGFYCYTLLIPSLYEIAS